MWIKWSVVGSFLCGNREDVREIESGRCQRGKKMFQQNYTSAHCSYLNTVDQRYKRCFTTATHYAMIVHLMRFKGFQCVETSTYKCSNFFFFTCAQSIIIVRFIFKHYLYLIFSILCMCIACILFFFFFMGAAF